MHDLLRGIRVIDLTTIVLGPYATRFLGDFGADVIKVESPDGDLFRSVRPGHSDRMGAAFISCNRNKRSIAIDLTHSEGKAALHRLIGTADVLVHNMRPKAARKLGIAYEDVRSTKPDVVYCYACGYGQDGRLADQPAYDDTIQAVSGLAFMNANAAGEPRFLPTIVGDKVAGLHLAVAILAGLAARSRTGEGVCIEAPMFESMVSFLLVEQMQGRTFEPPLGDVGYARLTSPYRKPFQSRDGYISILPYSTAHWVRFFEIIGRSDMIGDGRVTDPVERSRHIDMLYSIVETAAPSRTTAEWLSTLQAHDIPCASVNKLEDLLDDQHLREVGMFKTEDHPSEGRIKHVRDPFTVTGATSTDDLPAPELGEHGEAILSEVGYTKAEIEALADAGAVRFGRRVECGPATRGARDD